jgi:hypothetical protein
VIAAWPSFALTASYELLTRQVRSATSDQADGNATEDLADGQVPPLPQFRPVVGTGDHGRRTGLTVVRTGSRPTRPRRRVRGQDLQRRAWHWAMTHRGADGSLPSGKQIASHFDRHERWGRFVKRAGIAGGFSVDNAPDDRSGDGRGTGGHRDVSGQLPRLPGVDDRARLGLPRFDGQADELSAGDDSSSNLD